MTSMSLKTLQHELQSYLLTNNSKIVSKIISTQNLPAKSRLQIYQNSYYERIVVALSQDFPVLQASIGKDAFSSLVRDYIQAYPSNNFNLRYIGKNLSIFIAEKDPDFEPYADLAKLEWLMCEAKIDNTEKKLETRYNIMAVWEAFQKDNTALLFTVLPEKTQINLFLEKK